MVIIIVVDCDGGDLMKIKKNYNKHQRNQNKQKLTSSVLRQEVFGFNFHCKQFFDIGNNITLRTDVQINEWIRNPNDVGTLRGSIRGVCKCVWLVEETD